MLGTKSIDIVVPYNATAHIPLAIGSIALNDGDLIAIEIETPEVTRKAQTPKVSQGEKGFFQR